MDVQIVIEKATYRYNVFFFFFNFGIVQNKSHVSRLVNFQRDK